MSTTEVATQETNLHAVTLRSVARSIEPAFPSASDTLRGVAKALENGAPSSARSRVAEAIEAQIREAMAMDLQNLADDVRRGRYSDGDA